MSLMCRVLDGIEARVKKHPEEATAGLVEEMAEIAIDPYRAIKNNEIINGMRTADTINISAEWTIAKIIQARRDLQPAVDQVINKHLDYTGPYTRELEKQKAKKLRGAIYKITLG